MGFFNKLSKLINSAEETIKDVNKSISPPSTCSVNQSKQEPVTVETTAVVESNTSSSGTNGMNPKEVTAYFADILSSEFSGYQIRESVPLSEFGGEGRPYDFGLSKDGEFIGFVVLSQRNRTHNHPYWNSEKKAKELNIPFINFYTHMSNEREYVIKRINKFINV